MSPILLGEVEGANRASATVADEIFTANKINPLIEMLSQCMTEWLGPLFASPRERLAVWIQPATANDAEMSLKLWDLGLKQGAVSRNEYRVSMLGLQEKAGLDDFRSPYDARLASSTPADAAAADDGAKALLNPYNLRPLANGHGKGSK